MSQEISYWKTLVTSRLTFVASEPDMQGFYSCVLEDQFGNVTKSNQASIRMKGNCQNYVKAVVDNFIVTSNIVKD